MPSKEDLKVRSNISGGNMKTLKTGLVAALIALGFSSYASAGQRYLVVLKSNRTFHMAEKTFSLKGKFNLQAAGLGPATGPAARVDATVQSTLSNLNTLVVTSNETEIQKLRSNPEVALIEKEIFHPLPRPMRSFIVPMFRPTAPRQAPMVRLPAPWGIAAVRAPQAWPASNQGKGARVMVLDTGLDVNHPLIKNNFEKGRDFTSEGGNKNDITDIIGHGTHVSGTIAGVGIPSGFSGVAPQAKLLMGRVCSPEGCSNISVAEGIEWGIQEKVDVISMSLGGAMSTPGEKAMIASAAEAGVTVVAAAGNDGTGTVGYPAALPTVIAVGAVDSNLARASFSQFGPELTVVAPGVDVISTVPMGLGRESVVLVTMNGARERVPSVTFQGSKEILQPLDVEIVDAGFGRPEELAKANVAGKYALISRGETKIPEKIQAAIAAKAAGIVLYNNAPGLVHGALTDDGTTIEMAVHMVLQETGKAIKERLRQGDRVMVTLMTNHTDYDSYDGTSMATPHVSGVVALMKAANKNLKPADVKAILQKTAKPLAPNTKNEYGAGLVNAEAAVQAALGK
jgi:subtilisin family serine protease